MHAAKHVGPFKILRIHRDDDGAVAIGAGPVVIAHAVYHKTLGLTGGIDDIAARTHTEGKDSSSVRRAGCHLVIRRGKEFARVPILQLIQPVLRMLDPDPDGKGLRLHRYALLQQLGEGVPGTVADGQDDVVGL